MYNTPFKQAQYQKFNNTFLNKVVITFGLEEYLKDDSVTERMSVFSTEEFGVTPPSKEFNTAVYGNQDGSIIFKFLNKFVSVEIEGTKYNNFADTVISLSYKLRRYVEFVLKTNKIRYASIQKINLWQFRKEASAPEIDVDAVKKYVFSKEFNSLSSNEKLSKEEEEIDYFIKHRWKDETCSDDYFELRTCFIKIDEKDINTKQNIYGLILDSIAKNTNNGNGIEIEKIDTFLRDINTQLYNAYMWCVTDDVKNIMVNGK